MVHLFINSALKEKDRLNLYLVHSGLKPACICDEVNVAAEIKSYDLPFSRRFVDMIARTEYNELVPLKYPTLYIGKDKASLDRLLGAKTQSEIGLTLDYPKDAVDSYQQVIDGERRDGAYVQVCLAKAKAAGVEIPTWLAYITHIPALLNLDKGVISVSSENQGRLYQQHTHMFRPDLAEGVEKRLKNRRLPVYWEVDQNISGHYNIYYEMPQRIAVTGDKV